MTKPKAVEVSGLAYVAATGVDVERLAELPEAEQLAALSELIRRERRRQGVGHPLLCVRPLGTPDWLNGANN